jgi:tRNA(Ile)-lysidine synthase
LFDLAEEHQAFAVLTAHTLNDQAETFLMRLVRGSGTDGLGAIKVISNFEGKRKESTNEQNITLSPLHPFTPSQTKLIRPLLAWATREATENYCQKLDIEFRRDTMNDNVSFTRVRVRKQLIPFLKTFNPKIIETLATTAGLFHTDAEQLNSLATDFLQAYQFSLPIKESLALSPAVRRRVLRIWLKQERGSLRKITATHLLALESLILKNEGGRTIELPNKGFVTRRSGRLVYSAKVEKNDFDN